jgi:hypothetical protein
MAAGGRRLGIMPYIAAVWAMALYFTTPAAWLLTITQLFDLRIAWLIVL